MKTSKKALFGSILSLLLCCSMLIGTTFAWFTDEVSSGVNTIQSGTLDIDVAYTQDGTTWNNLDSATDLFSGALWEPGHTRVVALKITNNGSLALKYRMGLSVVKETEGTNVAGNPFKLSDYLEVSTLIQQANDPQGIGGITLSLAFQGENIPGYEDTNKLNEVSRESTLFSGDSHYLIIKVDMPTSVGNEANAQPGKEASIQFGIDIIAGQATSEPDSFGPDYDVNAVYEIEPVTDWYGDGTADEFHISTLAELKGFRDLVNSGVSFANSSSSDNGKHIYLDADIDLGGEEWIPIGLTKDKAFGGHFYGQGHTISNLKVTRQTDYAGLFGYVRNYSDQYGGTDKAPYINYKAGIEDLTIRNVTITGATNAGAFAGMLYKSGNAHTWYAGVMQFNNLKLTGNVRIEGTYAGGLFGGEWTDVRLNMSNITVDVNDGSYVSGTAKAGGIISSSPHTNSAENISSNIDVNGEGMVGGIAGQAGWKWVNVSCTGNVTLKAKAASDKYDIGTVFGTIADNSWWETWKGGIDLYNMTNISGSGTLTVDVDGVQQNTNGHLTSLVGSPTFDMNNEFDYVNDKVTKVTP